VRKVRLEQTRGDFINIYELEVIDLTNTNVARGKTATASSRFDHADGDPSRAVDGNTATAFHSKNCREGGDCPNPLLEIDLRSIYDVTKVKIYNRKDFRCRLKDAVLKLLDANGALLWSVSVEDTCYLDVVEINVPCQSNPQPGYIDIFVDSGEGYKMETIANQAWYTNNVVLDKCFRDYKGVQVKGPRNQG
jgi:hypothetical protein